MYVVNVVNEDHAANGTSSELVAVQVRVGPPIRPNMHNFRLKTL